MRVHQSSLAAALLAFLLFVCRESRAEPHTRNGLYLRHTEWGRVNGSLLLGLPLRPGLSLGVGGLASTMAITSSTHETQDEDPQLQLFGAVGPFVDFYPSATSGWHVQALEGGVCEHACDGRAVL